MLQVGEAAARRARYEGKTEEGGVAAGQVSGLIKSVKPAGDMVQDIVAEAALGLEKGLCTR
ncbi:hypothetical protein [Candidatus Entotheonella palauensis]|uniref:Nitronate monooxygenase domain-containing protein n=1 Tax=Candidatus Entotheonella gemina TaxID=1429439 RepID=W4M562_9BACT|nr:hypothetical protein [Candidatus Entotheonella palauensis]ETX05303.1 MAG: hypothetical protein ETSY2_23790 [Candidatus Entotheonella gemina]